MFHRITKLLFFSYYFNVTTETSSFTLVHTKPCLQYNHSLLGRSLGWEGGFFFTIRWAFCKAPSQAPWQCSIHAGPNLSPVTSRWAGPVLQSSESDSPPFPPHVSFSEKPMAEVFLLLWDRVWLCALCKYIFVSFIYGDVEVRALERDWDIFRLVWRNTIYCA